jgi:ribulose-phosphate 3-epimerase
MAMAFLHSPQMIKPPRIAPSILAADFAALGADIARVEPHVDMLHIDVMDGHFVPNISLGIPVIRSIRKVSELLFDCHLMTTNPDAYLGPLREAGADQATVHIEVFPDPTRVAAMAEENGLRFGLVLNPPTPFAAIEPYVELCDIVVVMSVHPGFGGQTFIEETLGKVTEARKFVDSAGLMTDIQVDGGIDPHNIGKARDAGADVFVAGTSVFRAPDPVAAVAELRGVLAAHG